MTCFQTNAQHTKQLHKHTSDVNYLFRSKLNKPNARTVPDTGDQKLSRRQRSIGTQLHTHTPQIASVQSDNFKRKCFAMKYASHRHDVTKPFAEIRYVCAARRIYVSLRLGSFERIIRHPGRGFLPTHRARGTDCTGQQWSQQSLHGWKINIDWKPPCQPWAIHNLTLDRVCQLPGISTGTSAAQRNYTQLQRMLLLSLEVVVVVVVDVECSFDTPIPPTWADDCNPIIRKCIKLSIGRANA